MHRLPDICVILRSCLLGLCHVAYSVLILARYGINGASYLMHYFTEGKVIICFIQIVIQNHVHVNVNRHR